MKTGVTRGGNGLLFNKIKRIEETEFIIIVIKRLLNHGQGLKILKNRLTLGGEVTVSDSQDNRANFKPVAVLFHIGKVAGGETFGHYKTDVIDVHGSWFRTSDEDIPKKITERHISDQGYIFLYRKTQ